MHLRRDGCSSLTVLFRNLLHSKSYQTIVVQFSHVMEVTRRIFDLSKSEIMPGQDFLLVCNEGWEGCFFNSD